MHDLEGLRGTSKIQERKIQGILLATQASAPVENKENKGTAKPKEVKNMKNTVKKLEDQITKLKTAGGGGGGGGEPHMHMEITTYDGAFIWKIEDLGRRINEAVTGKALSIYSTPFFVGRFGYKVCARVYLNGDGMGKGTHLSLFFVVMRGAYDALLPWPFQQKVSFKLIDQTGDQHIVDSFRPDPNSSSFQRPTGNMNIASGCPLFVHKSVLHSRGYIKDEALFFKITVDPTGIPCF